MDIRDKLRVLTSRREVSTQQESDLTPNAYYDVDEDQNVISNDVGFIEPEVVSLYKIYQLNRFFSRFPLSFSFSIHLLTLL